MKAALLLLLVPAVLATSGDNCGYDIGTWCESGSEECINGVCQCVPAYVNINGAECKYRSNSYSCNNRLWCSPSTPCTDGANATGCGHGICFNGWCECEGGYLT